MRINPFPDKLAERSATDVAGTEVPPPEETPFPTGVKKQESDVGTVSLFVRESAADPWRIDREEIERAENDATEQNGNSDKGLPKVRNYYEFDEFGVVFHFMFWPAHKVDRLVPWDDDRPDKTLDPIERDLLSYNIRDLKNRPFQSSVQSYEGKECAKVRVTFPQDIEYKGEGSDYRIVQCHQTSLGKSRSVDLHATACTTRFRNGSFFLQLGFYSDGDASLTDLELIALAKLWEEGEGYDVHAVTFDGEPIEVYAKRQFKRINDRQPEKLRVSKTETDLIKPGSEVDEESGDWLHLAGGTIQINHRLAYATLKSYLDSMRAENESQGDDFAVFERDLGRGLKGIETGLLDILNVDNDELQDSLDRFEAHQNAKDRLAVANKGTLLAICREDRLFSQHHRTMAVSPYLWLPHTVSIYNFVVLKTADQIFRQIRGESKSEDRYSSCEARMRSLIQEQGLRGVFHYPLERHVLKCCNATRGNVGQLDTAKSRLQAIDGALRGIRDNREKVSGWVLQVLLGVLAVFQLFSSYDQLNNLVERSIWPYVSMFFGSAAIIFLVASFSRKLMEDSQSKSWLLSWGLKSYIALPLAFLAMVFLVVFISLLPTNADPDYGAQITRDIGALRNAVKGSDASANLKSGEKHLVAAINDLTIAINEANRKEADRDTRLKTELSKWHDEEMQRLAR
jgi:hypothetical protein